MKKKFCVILCIVLVLSVFSLLALGSGSSEKKEIADESSESQSESKSETSESKAEEKSNVNVTIENQVLVDQDNIKVTALEYENDELWGDGIKLLVENNGDKTVTVSGKYLIVNNYMISDMFYSEIAAGKKSNETMYLSSSGLKAAGIETVGQIEVSFNVYDSDSYDTIFDTDLITIKTSEFANMDVTPNDVGKELYNDNGIKIIGKYVDENSFWGAGVLLYIENHNGKNITVSCEELSINGFMVDGYFSSTLCNEKMAIDEITIFSSDLEDNGITSIDEIELKFHIYDADNYETIVDTDAITFTTK